MKTTEEKAKAYADGLIVSDTIPEAIVPMMKDTAHTAFIVGANEAIASMLKVPKVELPEDGDSQAAHESRGGMNDIIASLSTFREMPCLKCNVRRSARKLQSGS